MTRAAAGGVAGICASRPVNGARHAVTSARALEGPVRVYNDRLGAVRVRRIIDAPNEHEQREIEFRDTVGDWEVAIPVMGRRAQRGSVRRVVLCDFLLRRSTFGRLRRLVPQWQTHAVRHGARTATKAPSSSWLARSTSSSVRRSGGRWPCRYAQRRRALRSARIVTPVREVRLRLT